MALTVFRGPTSTQDELTAERTHLPPTVPSELWGTLQTSHQSLLEAGLGPIGTL